MSTEQSSSSGTNDQAASGTDEKQTPIKDTVSYETHKKLLAEKKEASEKARQLEAKLAEIEKAKLEETGNYKKLFESAEAKAKEKEAELEGVLSMLKTAQKRNAVIKHLSGKIPEVVAEKILDVSGVVIDESGEVDDNTAKLVAQKFQADYGYLIQSGKQNGGLPSDAAGGPVTKLTYEDWKKLPAKEMAKRWKEVDPSTSKQ